MKTKLILTLASMLLFVTGLRAATPYAVYCEEDHSLHFLTAEVKPAQGSTLPSNNQIITNVCEVNLNQGEANPSWSGWPSLGTIQSVVFEESLKMRPHKVANHGLRVSLD